MNPDGVARGASFPNGLTAREAIPQAHKITLAAIAQGEPVVRYGQVIGHARQDTQAGSWVREDMLDLPTAPPLDALPLATAIPAPLPPLEGYTFDGYRNADGSVGTKNLLGITTTVQCAAPTVDYAVRRIREEILPRFPNVDGVIAINHTYGCGMAVDAPGAAIPIATLRHISQHANIGGSPLIVSLGCEKTAARAPVARSPIAAVPDHAADYRQRAVCHPHAGRPASRFRQHRRRHHERRRGAAR